MRKILPVILFFLIFTFHAMGQTGAPLPVPFYSHSVHGIYMIEIEDGGVTVQKKFIKES